jgi:hypothetical protein
MGADRVTMRPVPNRSRDSLLLTRISVPPNATQSSRARRRVLSSRSQVAWSSITVANDDQSRQSAGQSAGSMMLIFWTGLPENRREVTRPPATVGTVGVGAVSAAMSLANRASSAGSMASRAFGAPHP